MIFIWLKCTFWSTSQTTIIFEDPQISNGGQNLNWLHSGSNIGQVMQVVLLEDVEDEPNIDKIL